MDKYLSEKTLERVMKRGLFFPDRVLNLIKATEPARVREEIVARKMTSDQSKDLYYCSHCGIVDTATNYAHYCRGCGATLIEF